MPFARKRFGGNCNLTHCCKSLNKTTAEVSSYPRISFLRKSTRKDPPVKSNQKKPFLSMCYGDPSATEVPPCCESVTKKLTFSTMSVTLLLNVPLSLSRGTIFKWQKNPRRGYRPKIAGILFVCNEPGRSIPYCALFFCSAKVFHPLFLGTHPFQTIMNLGMTKICFFYK